jgi:outer membrane immunogenic protein
MKRLSLVFVGLVFGSAAMAADLGTAVIVPTAPHVTHTPFDWSGVYFGVDIGYGWGSSKHSFDNGAPSGNSEPDGVLGGGFIGYDWQVNNFVFGVEGDFEAADLSGSYNDFSGITSGGRARMEWDASIRARFGAAFGRSLLYATGGAAFARYEFNGGPATFQSCCGYSEDLTGWTLGGGWEVALTNRITTRIEYRYTDYGNASGPLKPTFPGVNMKVKNTTNVVRAGVAYRF